MARSRRTIARTLSALATAGLVFQASYAGPPPILAAPAPAGARIATTGPTSFAAGRAQPAPTLAPVLAAPDVTRPTIRAFKAPATPTNATVLRYTLRFSETVTGLAPDDFAITGDATGWSVSSIDGTGAGPDTITLAGGGAGAVTLTLAAGAVSDRAGNTGPAAATAAATVTVDRAAPDLTTFTAPASPTKAARLAYTLSFSEPVKGLAAADFTIGGDATGWIVGGVSGTGAGPYTVTLRAGGPGTVTLALAAGAVNDLAGNAGPAAAATASQVTVDRTVPVVVAFAAPTSPANTTSLAYTISFGKPVAGLEAADFRLAGTATGWSVTDIAGTGAGPYTVTLGGTATTAGTVKLSLRARTVADAAGNAGPATVTAAAPVTIDRTAPAVKKAVAPAGPWSSGSLLYTLTFSEPVTDLAPADFTISGTAAVWSVTGFTGSDAGPYSIVLDGTGAGTVVLTLAAAAVVDVAGNRGPTGAYAYAPVTVNPVPPEVAAFAAPATPTNATSLAYALSFDQPVSGLATSDFVLTGSATGWSLTGITGSGAGPYTVTLGGTPTTEGTLTFTLAAGAVTNAAGTAGPTAPAVAPTVTVDRTAPTVTDFTAPASPTNAGVLVYALTFAEPVSGLEPADLAITGSSTGWSVTSVSGTGAGPYAITLAGPGTTEGSLVLSLAAGAVTDLADNAGPASATPAASVTIDRTAPEVTTFAAPTTPTTATTLTYGVTFSEPVSGLAASSFVIGGSSTGWTVASLAGSGPGPYTVTLAGTGSTDGTVALSIAVGVVADAAGNAGPTTEPAAATITIDRTPPAVASFTAPGSPTTATSLAYELTFSEPVTGLAADDFAVSGTAAGWTVTDVAGAGAGPYAITLRTESPADGTLLLTLMVAAASDPVGNRGPVQPADAPQVETVAVGSTVDLGVDGLSTRLRPDIGLITYPFSPWTVRPGDHVSLATELSYPQAAIMAAATLAARNRTSAPAEVEAAVVALEEQGAGQSAWQPVAAYAASQPGWTAQDPGPGDAQPMQVTAVGSAASGVTYPETLAPFLGTSLGDGSAATWAASFSTTLDAMTLGRLQAVSQVQGVRLRLHLELRSDDPAFVQPVDVTQDLTSAIRSLDPAVSNARVTIGLGTASPTVYDHESVPALGHIQLGSPSINITTTADMPGQTAKLPSETDAEYVQRLRDAETVGLTALATATDSTGAAVTEDGSRTLQAWMPIIEVADVDQTADVVAGSSLLQHVTLANVGSGSVDTVHATAALANTVGGTVSTPGSIHPATTDEIDAAYAIPVTQAEGGTSATMAITWTDGDGHTYGPIAAATDVWVSNGSAGAPTVTFDPVERVLFGTEPIEAEASDDAGVVEVSLLADGVLGQSLTAGPYEFSWDTTEVSDGLHTLQVRVRDTDGSITTSPPRSVTVNNDLGTSTRVRVDRDSGQLSVDDAALYGVYAAIGSASLPARYIHVPASEGNHEPDPTASLWDALSSWDGLSTATQASIQSALQSAGLIPSSTAGAMTRASYASAVCYPYDCVATTHFSIRYLSYAIEPSDDHIDDTLQPCTSGTGACNGVPDVVDRVAVGLERAWTVYESLGFPMPPTPVDVSFNCLLAPNLGVTILGPSFSCDQSDTEITLPLAYHEFFHSIQAEQLFLSGWSPRLADESGSSQWWNEATAQWAAHKVVAQYPDPGGSASYRTYPFRDIPTFLASPEKDLTYTEGDYEYGAVLLPEFLEEYLANVAGFVGKADITADPGIVKGLWDKIWAGDTAIDAIDDSIGGGSQVSDALAAFARADYLLDPPSGSSIPGVYRDPDRAEVREVLRLNPWTGEVKGDKPTDPIVISSMGRPKRTRDAMPGASTAMLSAALGTGGSSYHEFKLARHGGAYSFGIDSAGPGHVVATIIGLSDYPTPCVADTRVSVDPGTRKDVTVYLPDTCTAVTVILTDPDLSTRASANVRLWAGPAWVTDSFGRSRDGWGVADVGASWHIVSASPFLWSVDNGVARFEPGSDVRALELGPFGSNILEMTAIGHFAQCTGSNEIVEFDTSTSVSVSTSGLVRAQKGGSASLAGFDPCQPWFIRTVVDGSQTKVWIWQATESAPVTPSLVVDDVGWKQNALRLSGQILSGGSAGDAFILSLIDLVFQPTA
jgi:hypothetical protein